MRVEGQDTEKAPKFGWVHSLCALAHDACDIVDFREMEIVLQADHPLRPEKPQACSLCDEDCGLVYPNRAGDAFVHLVCAKLEMLEKLEETRDCKVTGWSVQFLHRVPPIEAGEEEKGNHPEPQ